MFILIKLTKLYIEIMICFSILNMKRIILNQWFIYRKGKRFSRILRKKFSDMGIGLRGDSELGCVSRKYRIQLIGFLAIYFVPSSRSLQIFFPDITSLQR